MKKLTAIVLVIVSLLFIACKEELPTQPTMQQLPTHFYGLWKAFDGSFVDVYTSGTVVLYDVPAGNLHRICTYTIKSMTIKAGYMDSTIVFEITYGGLTFDVELYTANYDNAVSAITINSPYSRYTYHKTGGQG